MLEFEEESHVYTVDGEVVPSVTQILTPLGDLDDVPDNVLENARLRGTAVHKATELYDLGNLGEIDLLLQPYLDAWELFRNCYELEVVVIEHRLYHPDKRYAGTIDRVFMFKRRRILLDIKATFAHVASVGPQTAAYKELWEKNYPNDKIHERWSVRLLKDGKFDLVTLDNRSDIYTFTSCHNIWKWRQENL